MRGNIDRSDERGPTGPAFAAGAAWGATDGAPGERVGGWAGTGLGGETALEGRRPKRSGLRDESARVVHLPPRVPQQDATHATVFQVVDHALAHRLLPVGYGLEPRVQLADRLVAELEQVGVEERQVAILRPAGRPGHAVGPP